MSSKLIYVVDDDPVYGGTLKKILEVKQFENVSLFSNGEDCISQLHKKPALIILDFSLETLNGLDVLKWIKKESSSTKVVFLTSLNENKELQERCKQEGALGFFHKDQKGIDELVKWMDKNLNSGFLSFFK